MSTFPFTRMTEVSDNRIWEDTENKAEYKASGMGVSYAPNDKGTELNQRGLTPNLTPMGQVLVYDTLPLIGGAIGSVGGVPGAIIIGTGGDLLKVTLKDKIPTDKQLKDSERTRGDDE